MKGLQLIGLCVGVAAVCCLLAACGGGGGGETIEADTPPAKMLEATSLDGVSSGALEGVFEILNADQRNSLIVHYASGFNRLGRQMPQSFFLSIGSTGQRDGRPFEFNGRLFYSPTSAVLVYGPAFKELTYALDKTELQKFKSKIEAAQEEGGAAEIGACRGAAKGAALESLIRDPEYEGSTKDPTEGTRLFQVGGEIDLPALIDLLVQMAEDPDCGAQMEAFGLPSPTTLRALGEELSRRAEDSHLGIEIDQDGLLRSLEATLDSASAQTGKTELKFSLSLREVNEQGEVSAGAPGKHLAALMRKFGVEPQAILQATGDELFLGLLEGFGGGATGRLP